MSFEALQMQFLGLDEGTDPKACPPGTLLVAENCAMDKDRRITKRHGTDGLVKTKVGGGSIAAGKRLYSIMGNASLVDDTYVETYETQNASWVQGDRVPNLHVTKRSLMDGVRTVERADIAISGNLLVSAWKSGTGSASVFVQVQDATTGEIVMPARIVTGAAEYLRVVVTGGDATILWTSVLGNIQYATLDLQTFALGAPVVLVVGVAASSAFDAHVDAAGTVYLGYTLAAGVNRVTVASYTSLFALVSGPTSTGGVVLPNAMCIHGTVGENCYLAWSEAGATRVATFLAATLALTAGPTTLVAATSATVFVARFSATEAVYGYTANTGARESTSFRINGATHAIQALSTNRTYHWSFISKPWLLGGRWYIAMVSRYSAEQLTATQGPESSVVVEILTSTPATLAGTPPHRHLATLETQTAWTPSSTGFEVEQLAQAAQGAASTYLVSPVLDVPTFALNANTAIVSLGKEDAWRPSNVAAVQTLAGGVLVHVDGSTAQPYGFLTQPAIKLLLAGAPASGLMTAGTYFYVIVYAWRDARGVLHRSQPSRPQSVVAAANGSIQLTAATATLDGKLNETSGFTANAAYPVLIEIYRTTMGGSIFYRLTHEPTTNTLFNNPLVDYVTFTDTRNDVDIGNGERLDAQPQVYTASEVDDIGPPAFTTTTSHRGRIAGIASDEYMVWLTKDAGEDLTLAPGFNEALALTFTTRKTALASLDEKLIVFGVDDVDMVVGDGPDSNGNQNTWQIVRVQTDIGCSQPRSVVTTPFGVAFRSSRGLELLTRGLTVEQIGTTVEDTLAAFPVTTSAVLVPDESEIRWSCNNAAGTAGVVIAWNYLHKIWMVRKYKDAADTDVVSMPIADAALIDNVYTLLTPGGQVYREDEATKLDDGTDFVSRDVQLAWISPGGPNGWYRFKSFQVLGTSVTNHDLKVSVGRDYAAAYEQDNTFPAQGAVTAIGPLEKCRITVQNQKAQAIRIRLQDLPPTTGAVGTGEGPIWEGLALQLLKKRGTTLNSAARQA